MDNFGAYLNTFASYSVTTYHLSIGISVFHTGNKNIEVSSRVTSTRFQRQSNLIPLPSAQTGGRH